MASLEKGKRVRSSRAGGEGGLAAGVNYAGVAVTAAVDYAPNLAGGLALVMEKKTADFMAPSHPSAVPCVAVASPPGFGALTPDNLNMT